MRRAPGQRTRLLGFCAAAMVLPLSLGLSGVVDTAVAQAESVRTQPVGAAAVQRVDWLTDRRVALWVTSPSMGAPVQVQLLLARDWNAHPEAKFPALYMLDGLRAQENESGWTLDAGGEEFFADKNVNVVLPIGGQSSFYSDWLTSDNGVNYQWETFLTKELPPLLESQWRTTDVRGVAGLSMGGTSAMFLAARNPGFAKYAASYSGFLTTTSLGMPQAITYAMGDAGGFDSDAMWGPPTNPAWAEHDPYLLADKLQGVSLYVSSGSGMTGPYDQAAGIPGVSTNVPGMGLEILSRLTSQSFATKLNKLGIPAQVNYRPVRHPLLAVLGLRDASVLAAGRGGARRTGGQARLRARRSDRRHRRLERVARRLHHRRVQRAGRHRAGLPVRPGVLRLRRRGVPGGGSHRRRLPGFRRSKRTAGHADRLRAGCTRRSRPVPGVRAGHVLLDPADRRARGERRDPRRVGQAGLRAQPARLPETDESKLPNKPGAQQGFEIGSIWYGPDTGAHAVQGLILAKYGQMGYEDSWLGFPKSSENAIKDFGKFNDFEGGAIYWSPLSGAYALRNGAILNAWRAAGAENGKLGFPTSDEFDIPGGTQQNFQLGHITVKGDAVEVS